MSLSANLYSVAKSVLSKTGVDATLICPSTNSEYDPETGTTNTTFTTYPVRVAVMDFALISNGILADKGTLNTSNDKQVYMDATQVDGNQPPVSIESNGFKLLVDGVTYRITVVKSYNPSRSSCIMYDLKVEL